MDAKADPAEIDRLEERVSALRKVVFGNFSSSFLTDYCSSTKVLEKPIKCESVSV